MRAPGSQPWLVPALAIAAVVTAIFVITTLATLVTTTATPMVATAIISGISAAERTLLRRTIFTRASLAHAKGATTEILAIEPFDSRLRFRIGSHCDEAESARAIGLTIEHDLNGRDRSALLKELLQLGFGCLVREVGDVKTVAHE